MAILSRPPHRRISGINEPLARRKIAALKIKRLSTSLSMTVTKQTRIPNALGFRMPAEWEPHAATWLGWPHELTDWPGKFSPIPWAFAEIVRHLSQVERVYLLVESLASEKRVKVILKKAGANLDSVDFFRVPTDRGWMRDSGPICVKNASGQVAYNNFVFNGWAKYSNHKKDAAVVAKANQRLKRQLFIPTRNGRRVVLEGGSIDVNGRGTLLTTEECLQSRVQERNPGFTKHDYEDVFREYLRITNVLWLGNGIAGDDTHGHVDDLTRFVDATTVVTIVEENRDDPNYSVLQDNFQRLKSMTDQDGKSLRVETLPMPAPVYFDGQRLPASYANFYIANKLVIVPTFNDANDRVALNILAKLFPNRQIVGIHCRDLVLGLGTLHCMTQQEPAAG
jgi:agmatine deiminase